MHCSHECLITSCILLAVFVAIQISVIAISYTDLNRHIIQEAYLGDRVTLKSKTGQLPSALIVGVRKGGTRALLDALGLHPNIRIVRRETHFFDLNYGKGLEWYQSYMPSTRDDQIVIEKTPAYFTNINVPLRVHQLNPAMKIILIIRDPVQRTVSDFTQVYYNKQESNKTLPIFEDEVFLPGTKDLNLNYKPIRNSLYHLHLENWLKYFSTEQILLVNGDVFRGNPLNELRKVEKFLGLNNEISTNQLVFNEKKGFFCFLRRQGEAMKCLGNSKGRPHRNISSTTLETLRDQLKPHNQLFFQQINRIYSW